MEMLRWYEVSYYVDGDGPHSFACTKAWTRREAYFEVMWDIRITLEAIYGPGRRMTWDADAIEIAGLV